MAMIQFHKMEAQGNDFVIVDGRDQPLPTLDRATIRRWCDRRLGIGCDQLLLLDNHPSADAAMRIFNNDGSEAANCGNGARCVADLLMRQAKRDSVQLAIADRTISARREQGGITVAMGTATILDSTEHHADVQIGNRHRVYFDGTEQLDPALNIEIITGHGDHHLWIDIIERGAGRTPACGSGACAVAAAWWQRHGNSAPLTIVMPGGEVVVRGSSDDLHLTGAVHASFRGYIPALTIGKLSGE